MIASHGLCFVFLARSPVGSALVGCFAPPRRGAPSLPRFASRTSCGARRERREERRDEDARVAIRGLRVSLWRVGSLAFCLRAKRCVVAPRNGDECACDLPVRKRSRASLETVLGRPIAPLDARVRALMKNHALLGMLSCSMLASLAVACGATSDEPAPVAAPAADRPGACRSRPRPSRPRRRSITARRARRTRPSRRRWAS